MKPDTERKKYHKEKLHKRKKRMHAHISKELRSKLKNKKRSLLLHKGDLVRVMRGPNKGKEAKIGRVNTVARKIYLEGVTVRNARGKEAAVPLEPSNLLLISPEPTPERKKMFSEDAFRKEPVKKKAESKKAPEKEKPEVKEAPKPAPKEAPPKEAPKAPEPPGKK